MSAFTEAIVVVIVGVAGMALAAGTIAVLSFAEAMVLWQLWAWFAVPLGVAQISIPHAIGLNALLQVFAWRYIPRPDGDDQAVKALKAWAVMLLWAISVGFVVSRFM